MSTSVSVKYWCHTCRAETVPVPVLNKQNKQNTDEELECPRCHDCFVEIIEQNEHPSGFVPMSTANNGTGALFTVPLNVHNHNNDFNNSVCTVVFVLLRFAFGSLFVGGGYLFSYDNNTL